MPPAGSLLKIIADSIPEPALVFSTAGRLEAVNAAATALTGLQDDAVGGITLAELLGDRTEAAAILAEEPDRNHGRRQRELSHLTLYTSACGRSAFRGESWRIVAGDQVAIGIRLFEPEAQLNRRVLTRIAESLTTSKDLPAGECQVAGLAAAITEVCVFTGWAYAEAWVPAGAAGGGSEQPRQALWVPHPFWYGNREKYGAFRALSVKAAAAAPLPLVTSVAQAQSSSWYSDVSTVPLAIYRRARAAREVGLKATFAQPIVEGGRTLAVLVFMMAEVRVRDDTLAALMAEVAHRLAPRFRTTPAESERLAAAALRQWPGQSAVEAAPSALAMLCRLLDGLGKPAIIVAREDRRIVWINAAACRLFDYEHSELAGQSTAILYVDAQAFEEFDRRARPVLEAGKPFRHRFWMLRKDGVRFASEHLAVSLGEVAGRMLSVSLVSDLSEVAGLTFGRRLEQLTAREQEVLQLTIVGDTVTEIAARLHLSVRTVETHRSKLLHKLGCASTTKLLAELLAESLAERPRL